MPRSVVQSILNRERSTQGRRQLVLARVRAGFGRMVPAAMVAATRRMSAQFRPFTLPPTSGQRCFRTPARPNTWRRFEDRSRMRGTKA